MWGIPRGWTYSALPRFGKLRHLPRDIRSELSQFSVTAALCFFARARSAVSPSLWRDSRIFSTPAVAIFAMGPRSLTRETRRDCGFPCAIFDTPRGKYFSQGKPELGSFDDRIRFPAGPVRQIDGFVGHSLDNDHSRPALISLLISLTCPSTIFGAVRAIIVGAFNAVPRRTIAHVIQEILEGIDPSVTDKDSTTSVVRKLPEVRIVTSALHPLPDRVKRMGVFKWHTSSPKKSFGTPYHVMRLA